MTVSFFLLFLSLALLSLPSSISCYLFIFPIWEVKSESGGVKGRGGECQMEGASASAVWFTRLVAWLDFFRLSSSVLRAGGSVKDLAAWSSPHPTIATQIPLLPLQLHRSHNLACPLLLPQLHPPTTTTTS